MMGPGGARPNAPVTLEAARMPEPYRDKIDPVTTIWLNGELVASGEAKVPALDRGVLWGYGLFETMRVYGGRVWALPEHYERMAVGAGVIDLPIPAADVLREAIDAVLRANGLIDAGARITITRGAGPPDPHSEPDEPPNVIVTAWPVADYTELYERGVALVSVPGGGRPLAGVKTTSYAVSVAGRILARRAGADDALFVGPEGRVLEGTGSNLFAVIGDRVVTPPIEEAVLPGVTRRHVLTVAASCGRIVAEEPLHLSDLFAADEVLLTSSLREVYPVRSIDGRDVQRGPWTDRLRAGYRDYVRSASSG